MRITALNIYLHEICGVTHTLNNAWMANACNPSNRIILTAVVELKKFKFYYSSKIPLMLKLHLKNNCVLYTQKLISET